MAPVRANVRGTRADHAIWTLSVSPGPTGVSSGTSATVRSSTLPSSGAMNCRRDVTSLGVPLDPIRRTAVMSVQPQSSGPRRSSAVLPARRRSRIHDDRVFRQAL